MPPIMEGSPPATQGGGMSTRAVVGICAGATSCPRSHQGVALNGAVASPLCTTPSVSPARSERQGQQKPLVSRSRDDSPCVAGHADVGLCDLPRARSFAPPDLPPSDGVRAWSRRRQEEGLRLREPLCTSLLVALTPAPCAWVGSVHLERGLAGSGVPRAPSVSRRGCDWAAPTPPGWGALLYLLRLISNSQAVSSFSPDLTGKLASLRSSFPVADVNCAPRRRVCAGPKDGGVESRATGRVANVDDALHHTGRVLLLIKAARSVSLLSPHISGQKSKAQRN